MAGRVIVTGGCGFIGSAVVQALLRRGYFVRVIDDLSKPESRPERAAGETQIEFVNQDLTDTARTQELFSGFDSCIHLAARIGGIGYFHRNPAGILSDNNKICSSVFEAAVATGMLRLVYVSSSMVFESTTHFPSREEDINEIPMPQSAYGFSKLIGEWYCRSFHEQYGLPFTIVRPFNAYGIHEAPGEEVGYAHVIPDLVKKLLSGQRPLQLLGDGTQTRCFTHVWDIADGIVTALSSPHAVNEDFNISSPEETTVLDLARSLWELCRISGPVEVSYVPGFKHDVARRIPSVDKARRVLGWEARYRLHEKLPEVVEWIRTQLAS